METVTRVARHTRYRRCLENGNFSLEANTEAVPEAGHFYLLQGGEVLSRTDDFASAEAGYFRLCREHWEGLLESDDAGERRRSALGILGHDPGHALAAAVLRRDGNPADNARVERVKKGRLSEERRANARGGQASKRL
jgi:hypothetical protein